MKTKLGLKLSRYYTNHALIWLQNIVPISTPVRTIKFSFYVIVCLHAQVRKNQSLRQMDVRVLFPPCLSSLFEVSDIQVLMVI